MKKTSYYGLGLILLLIHSATQAATPLWTITPVLGSQTTQTVPANSTATVQYLVQNQSNKTKNLAIQPLVGLTQTTPCQLAPKGQVGSSCTLNLSISGSVLPPSGIHGGPSLCQTNSNGSPNPNQCYQPSSANSLNISRGDDITLITAIPTNLQILENSTGNVTVTNDPSSHFAADNIMASIPAGSGLSVQSTTCGASLPIGASCVITFAATTAEGPTTVTIAGTNTNTVSVSIVVGVMISLISPTQQNRIVPVSGGQLNLQIITLSGSGDAMGVTVIDHSACPNLVVDDSNCIVIVPGGLCNLLLSSPSPYAPCNITISGSNTNSITTLIAFSYLGGLVFEEAEGSGKIVIDAAQEFSSRWTNTSGPVTGAASFTDGIANTNAITAATTCTNNPANCAAQLCRNINVAWYLPARDELTSIHNSLCSNGSLPCNFGGFSNQFYWSSSVDSSTSAWVVQILTGTINVFSQTVTQPARCTRTF